MGSRRLAAIVFTDIVGYTALMAKSESAGVRLRDRHRRLARSLVEQYGGTWHEERGDESLSTFASALDAVNCALSIQEAAAQEPELMLRIGIHVGDILFDGGSVYGDGVNVASRVRERADPGGVCVSSEVRDALRSQPHLTARAIGIVELKHVGRPMELFRMRGEALPPSAAVGSSATGGRIASLAVLPLEDLSGDPAQEYFADGMTAALIADLAGIRALRVISRTSVLRYKHARKPLPEIARELDVDAVLEGTVVRAGERVRISVQLVDAHNDAHLWAERFDRDVRDLLVLQADVARSVASCVEATLTPEEHRRLTQAPRVDPRAEDAYLRGLAYLGRSTVDGMRRAIEHFEEAARRDSRDARPHVGLAMAHYLLAGPVGDVDPAEEMPAAQAGARRALELDPEFGQAHAMLGWVKFVDDHDWDAAQESFQRALELSPGDALTQSCYADYCATLGRFEEAFAASRRAVALSRMDLGIRQSAAELLFFARRYDEAIDAIHEVVELEPTRPQSYLLLGEFQLAAGREAEGIEAHLAWAERVGFPERALAESRRLAREGGVRALSQAALAGFTSRAQRTYVSPLMLATLQMRAGDREGALGRLEACLDGPSVPGLAWLRVHPTFDPLRDHPRFGELVRRLGIPPPATEGRLDGSAAGV
jgi:TolB-like protein/class 3 adenylate cyclase/tetratricopeptide (TPR) repeat protein